MIYLIFAKLKIVPLCWNQMIRWQRFHDSWAYEQEIKNIANWQLEKSNERKKNWKKKRLVFFQNVQLLNFKEKKKIALKLFEFVEKFMMDTFC